MADYRVALPAPQNHRYAVTLRLARPAALQRLSLPVWAPGSYVIRDFARHLSGLRARQGERTLAVEAVDLSRWQVACGSEEEDLVVDYEVYAFDPSVRGAWLDTARGFVNGPALFLRAEGRDDEPQRVCFDALPAGWQVATAMTAGDGGFVAADYAELIDHPFALGALWRAPFEAGGVAHELCVTGAWPTFDGERLVEDLRRLCATQVAFWGEAPMARYAFLLHAGDDGYGGLEHRCSTALTVPRRDLPRRGDAGLSDGAVGVLALAGHEYFHAWNGARLKAPEYVAPRLDAACPSPLLWFYEGFTTYYEDALLLRAGLIDRTRYLKRLAQPINAVRAAPGRHVQSLAEASFEAWTKLYRRDENTLNATVSYYDQGALVALLADLALRRAGRSLDDVMRTLWRRGTPADEAAIADALGEPVAADVRRWVHGRGELPLAEALAAFAITLRDEPPALAARLGLRVSEGPLSGVQVRQVLRGGAAEAAGLAAGDELLAADGWRLRRLDDALQWVAPGRPFELLLARDQRLLSLPVAMPAEAATSSISLVLDDNADVGALARRRAWLGA
jgi:predicted metalloprotease with PDZ domain